MSEEENNIDSEALTLTEEESKIVSGFSKMDIFDVQEFEDKLIAAGLNDADRVNEEGLTVKLVDGMFARILKIKKGTFITGRIHKRPYIDIFISGDITVKSFMADGSEEEAKRINSFTVFEGLPGRKRVLYAHEDTTWVTVDPTTVTKVEDAVDDITTFQMEEYKMLEDN